jgi:hypothetical protein
VAFGIFSCVGKALSDNEQVVPLEKIPIYAPNSYPNRYWTAERNTTEWSVFMKELVLSSNELTKIKLQALSPSLKGANLGMSLRPGIRTKPLLT